MLTKEMVQRALPPNLKGVATQAFTDQINGIVSDPEIAEQVRNNFISYTSVLSEGKFKVEDYLHAVVFASFKLMNMSNQDAYFRTFPQRHANMLAKGMPAKDIAAYVSMYFKGKLVQLVLQQTLTPSWVLNQDLYQKAINVQADLMCNAQSEKVRCEAANSLITALAKPKDVGPLINIGVNESSGLTELKATLLQLAEQQQQLISQGISPKEIAGQRIIEGEKVE